jgi:hypothetical protein
MAKLKTRKQKPISKAADAKGAIPCLLLVIGVIVLLGFVFYAMLKSAS